MSKRLHIVCLEAPAPPDYGGVIDMYYKIKALAEAGIRIHLHYFDYKKNRQIQELSSYCEKIFAYHRKSFLQAFPFSKPYIVASRINGELIERLNADEVPILIEYIHCTGILPYLKNKRRRIVVRLHNDEAIYYNELAKIETNFFKRAYYKIESWALNRYQKKLPASLAYVSVSPKDVARYKNLCRLEQVHLLPVFVPWKEVTSLPGSGSYCLYQGNLAVAENEAAARWLIQHVFSQTDLPLIIAGKKIPARLVKAAAPFQNIRFVSGPPDATLTELIQHAHIHVLPDFNKTGVKLKLLHALFCGRFCITNNNDFESSTVAVAQTAEDYMRFLKSFSQKAFTENDIAERKKTLQLYNNQANTEILSAHLW